MDEIDLETLHAILSENGFTEIIGYYSESTKRYFFQYKSKYKIIVENESVFYREGSSPKHDRQLTRSQLIGIFVYLKLGRKYNRFLTPMEISRRYFKIKEDNARFENNEKILSPFEKKIVELFEAFDLK